MKKLHAYTIIELLVALAIIGTLLTLAAPRYLGNIDRSKEEVLRENLYTLRDSIDKYYSDNGKYPAKLEDLVEKRYLRAIPKDPITESALSWRFVYKEDDPALGIYDVKSTAAGKAKDGTVFQSW